VSEGFYKPDALPVTQPSVSKHWRELKSTHHNQGISPAGLNLCWPLLDHQGKGHSLRAGCPMLVTQTTVPDRTKINPIYHHNHNHFTALLPGPPGELAPEENCWTLWCKGRLTGRHIDNPAGHHSIQSNQCPPPPSPHFLQAGWPSYHQPTVSKHWRQLAHSD